MTCPTTRPRLYQNGQANSSRQNDFARPDDSVGRVGLVAGRASFRRAISLAGLPDGLCGGYVPLIRDRT